MAALDAVSGYADPWNVGLGSAPAPYGCRLFKLTLAAEDADAGAFHCTDVGVASDGCIP
jgi:hypothetical protein